MHRKIIIQPNFRGGIEKFKTDREAELAQMRFNEFKQKNPSPNPGSHVLLAISASASLIGAPNIAALIPAAGYANERAMRVRQKRMRKQWWREKEGGERERGASGRERCIGWKPIPPISEEIHPTLEGAASITPKTSSFFFFFLGFLFSLPVRSALLGY